MNRFLPYAVIICLVFAGAIPLRAFEIQWMVRVVEKGPCIETLGPVVSSPSTCWSWTKGETARPISDLSGNQIYIGGTDSFLHVLDAKSGRSLHRLRLEGNLVSAPVLNGSSLIFGTDEGFVYNVAQLDRAIIWKSKVDAGVLQSIILNADKAYAVSQLGTLYALSLSTGEVLWSKKRELPNRVFLRHLSAPKFFSTQISGSNRDVMAVGDPNGKLEFFDPENGELLEEIQLGNLKEPFADVATRPVIGQNILWAAAYNVGLVALDRESRIRKWDLKEKGITQLAVSNEILVAAGAKFVLGVNIANGKVIWKFSFDKGAPGPIDIIDREVIIGSDTGALYVLNLFSGRPKTILGSGLGFAGGIEKVGDRVLGMSSAGVLFSFGPAPQVVSKRSIARN